MLSTAASDHPFDWEKQLRPLCMAYNTSVNPTTGFSPFFLMFGRQAHMPVDLMYGPPTPAMEKSTNQFANDLRNKLDRAYQRVREQMGHMLDHQKAHYDKRAHGEPYKEGDLVWLHSTVVPRGRARKLHRPWTGPYRVVRKLSDVTYRIQDIQASRRRPIVHFDRLKQCPNDIRLPHLQCHNLPRNKNVQDNQSLPGTHLTIVECDQRNSIEPDNSNTNSGAPQIPTRETRYPQRNRHPPDRLLPFIQH